MLLWQLVCVDVCGGSLPPVAGKVFLCYASVLLREESSHLKVLEDGVIAFERILTRIRASQSSIFVRAFVWRDDVCGNALAKELLDAACRGIVVRIEKDRVGAVYEYTGGNKQSFFHKQVLPSQGMQSWFLSTVYQSHGSFRQIPNPLADQLVAHKNVAVLHRLRRFDHSKLFIFDDDILILGSMGIGDNHHTQWMDVMVEVVGSEHVARYVARQCGEQDFDAARRIDFLIHSNSVHSAARCPLLEHRIGLLDQAKRSIVIEMAYLGDSRFTNALVRASQRGVQITLVTSANADVLGNVNRATCHWLLQSTQRSNNLRIFLTDTIVHSKFVVIDRMLSDIGSANFTSLSHGVYEEVNLYVVDRSIAEELQAIAQKHCERGVEVRGTLSYKKVSTQIERAVVAFQSRKTKPLFAMFSKKAKTPGGVPGGREDPI